MGLLSEIKELKQKQITLLIAVFLGTVCPGFLVIFHFRPELVERYDAFKLILLSLSLTMPLVALNTVLGAYFEERNRPPTEQGVPLVAFSVGLFLTAASLFPALLLSYVYGYTFRRFGVIAAGLEFLLLVTWSFSARKKAVK